MAVTHTDAGHNLDSGTSCKFGRNHHSLSHVSPGLGALANYGGPTPTLQLKAGSAAINAASNTVCKAAPINNLDQPGIRRITATDPTCDIGADLRKNAGKRHLVSKRTLVTIIYNATT